MQTIGVSPISSVALSLMPRRVADVAAVAFSVTNVAAQDVTNLPLVLGVAVHFWWRRSRNKGKWGTLALGARREQGTTRTH